MYSMKSMDTVSTDQLDIPRSTGAVEVEKSYSRALNPAHKFPLSTFIDYFIGYHPRAIDMLIGYKPSFAKGDQMKPRRVLVTIELTTAASIKELKFAYRWCEPGEKVHQVQVNVIKEPKKGKK